MTPHTGRGREKENYLYITSGIIKKIKQKLKRLSGKTLAVQAREAFSSDPVSPNSSQE